MVDIARLAMMFHTYRSAYDIACLGSMTDYDLVGTFFVIPESIDVGGSQSVTSDELAVFQAKRWEVAAYGSNAGQTMNFQQMYTADRKSLGLRFKTIVDLMRAKGFPPKTITAMQRAWYPQITEMVRPWFDQVIVASNYDFATYPISRPIVEHGGFSPSWGASDTFDSLKAMIDSLIESKGLGMPVIHDIGSSPDAYTVAQTVFDPLMAYIRDRVNAGVLEVTTVANAMYR